MTLFGYRIERGAMAARPPRRAALTDGNTLVDVRPGNQVQLRGFAAGLSAERFAQMQAYGLTPGRWVRVLQHSPVTVIQVEHCELALEADLARQVEVVAAE